MNIIKEYRGGNAIPDLEVVEFWKDVLKDGLTDVILTDHYSFPKNGTLASTPHAAVDLFALKQSYLLNFCNLRTVSLWNSSLLGAI